MTGRNEAMAREAWGEPPDWVLALARECDRTNQTAAGARCGVNGSAVNGLLRNRYAASTHRMEQRIRGALLGATIECPALGELPRDQCQTWQTKAERFVDTSSQRARMYRACRACPHGRFSPSGRPDGDPDATPDTNEEPTE